MAIRRVNIRGPKLFSTKLPIVQAPMSGGMTGSSLIVAASNADCLGSIGAGYMTSAYLHTLIRDIRSQIFSAAFNVNLMVPANPNFKHDQIRRMLNRLSHYYKDLGINLPVAPVQDLNPALFKEQIQIVIDEKIPIVSFVFGIPNSDTIRRLKDAGIQLIGTATTVEEGEVVEAAGFDAVVAQGAEAGGHRGSFLDPEQPMLIPLHELVSDMKRHVKIPIIASGGIMNGRGVVSALQCGASAVQMGTAFLTTHECSASQPYKDALLNSTGRTQLTRIFSGKWARGIPNKFMLDHNEIDNNEIPDYPIQNMLTTPLRQEAAAQNKTELLSLWAGTGYGLCKKQSVQELVHQLRIECSELGFDFEK